MTQASAFFRWWLEEISGGSNGLEKVLCLDFTTLEAFVPGAPARKGIPPLDGMTAEKITKLFPKQRFDRLAVKVPEILEKTVTLPEAARGNLRETLRYDIDRQTPFRAEDVLFSYRVTGHDPEDKTFNVSLTLLPIATAQRLKRKVLEWGYDLAYAGHDLEEFTDNVLADTAKRGHAGAWTLVRVATIVALGTALLVLPVWRNAQTLQDTTQRLETAKAAAAATTTGLADLKNRLSWTDAALKDDARFLNALQNIAAAFEGRGVMRRLVWQNSEAEFSAEIMGDVDNASDFIRRLAETSGVAGVEYLSPIEKAEKGEGESFALKISFRRQEAPLP